MGHLNIPYFDLSYNLALELVPRVFWAIQYRLIALNIPIYT